MSIENSKGMELPFNMPELTSEGFVVQKKEFAQYLLSREGGVKDIDRDTQLGKYLRTMRFYATIDKNSHAYGSPMCMKGALTLAMQESKGDPVSRNQQNNDGCDGGAGLFHTQPDTGKNDLGLSLYSDKEGVFKKPVKVGQYFAKTYKECDYSYLRKTKKFSHEDAYKIHGAGIIQLKEDMSLSVPKLSSLDDRFDDEKNIIATIKYFKIAQSKIQAWAKHFGKALSPQQVEMYILNSYNKGFNWTYFSEKKQENIYNKNPRFTEGGSHMTNLKANLHSYERYNKILEEGIKQGLSYEQIYIKLTGSRNISGSSTKKPYQEQGIRKTITIGIEAKINKIQEGKQKNLLIAKQLLNQIVSEKENTNYKILLAPSSNADTMHFQMVPTNDNSKKYSFMIDTKGSNWVLRDQTGVELQFHQRISVGASNIIRMFCAILNNTFAHHPDDIEKGVCRYKNGEIIFSANWELDPVIASVKLLEPISKAFPDKSDLVCQKLVTIINNIYKNPGKTN